LTVSNFSKGELTMTGMIKLLVGGAGLAVLAAAAPSAAQYYGYSNPYSYNSYGYQSYGYQPYAMNTSMATQQCTAAVNNRLYTRRGLGGILGSLIGAYATTPQVLSVTRVIPHMNGIITVRGLASSGRSYGYGPYGMGAYGALGYGSSADLGFRCDVDVNGYVRNVDVYRR
jgi:hypothetical protein